MTARVLIDGHMLGSGETGNETYVRGLLAGLTELGRREAVAVTGPEVDVGAHERVVLPGRSDIARLTRDLVGAARDRRAQVIHSTYAAPLFGAVTSVLTVHDVSFLRHPEWFTLRDRVVLNAGVRASVRRAARVLVPSGHARDELCALLRVAPERVVVTPEGVDRRFAPPQAAPAGAGPACDDLDALLRRLGIHRPYALAVGNLQPRKNLARLIEAWALLAADDADRGRQLVVAGAFRGRRDGATGLAIQLHIGDRVAFPGYVADADLPALYGGADVFVLPSLYEGFGLPVLEAMACGTPVACSRTTALPEVAGGAAALFDPHDPADIAATLRAVLADEALRADLRERGLRRASRASWRACAELTAAAYDAAAAEAAAS
ncbi:MAG TPA: glycosyltransferase family 1 protein [Thermoleophilia bacterium]|nr:glycosyltransferase family 1 protein [Thermoleophilia bacterium]